MESLYIPNTHDIVNMFTSHIFFFALVTVTTERSIKVKMNLDY